MAIKIKFSEELGLQLKEFRNKYQVKAKDLAEFIEKSPAYISKLERGQIQQVDKNEFVKITNFIAKSEEGYYLFCEKIAEAADAKELDNNLLLLNFDLLERRIPITEHLIEIVKQMMTKASVNAEELISYINQNEDLSQEFLIEHKLDPNTIEKNVWHPYTEADSLDVSHSLIFLNYSLESLTEFLEGNVKKCEYMFLYAVVYHLLKLLHKSEGMQYDDELINKCKIEAEEILLNEKFYSLSVKARLQEQSETEEEYKNLLNEFDVKNVEYIMDIVSIIRFLSEYDVSYTNDKLKAISDNLKNGDPSFALAFMAMSINKLNDLSPTIKREFLKEVSNLIEKYTSMSNVNEVIEKY